MRCPTSLVLLVGALAFALAGCGGNDEDPVADDVIQTFEITITSFDFDPADIEVGEPGAYAFEIVNEGDHPHALAIGGPGVDESTPTIDPGETTRLVVELQDGRYELWCPVPGHREQGMEGTLTVANGADVEGGDAPDETDEADEPDEPAEEEVPDY